jgi:hypothetical protein
VRNKFIWFSSTVLATLAACFLLRMGQTRLEGLRGEPSQIVPTHSAETLAKRSAPTTRLQIALPKNELGELGEKTLASFPTFDDFKKLSEEQVHTMPAILFAAGLRLKTFEDKLTEKMKSVEGNSTAEKTVASEGAAFYQNCSNRENVPDSLRAVCYLQFIKLSVASGHPEMIPENQMPPEVLRIARAISPTNSAVTPAKT